MRSYLVVWAYGVHNMGRVKSAAISKMKPLEAGTKSVQFCSIYYQSSDYDTIVVKTSLNST